MPTPRKGETREQMNERLHAGKAPRIAKAAETAIDPVAVDLDRGRWAPTTRIVYDINWRDFTAFCAASDAVALPAEPQTVADYLSARAETHSTSAVSQRLAAVKAVHELYGHTIKIKGTAVADAWADIRRRKGLAKTPKAALALKEIKRIVHGIPGDKLLHRAIMLVGFASAMRRSELAALNREDVELSPEGMSITIRRSKTDKSGKGETIAMVRTGSEFCPVTALEQYLEHAQISEGALFLNSRGHRIAARDIADQIVKRWAKAAGFDPRSVGAHSLRRGCITSMYRNGSDLKSIMRHSRHRTVDIAMGYVEAQRAMQNPAVAKLGL